ncbi:uncharacterized protein LOC124414121 [Diprion similis]|uniref:uncharacterized protein LOC124414121 n=1 Tax=Diprion similis TaxID=362088 RepID=UPI001EF78ABF|nr:uncharacterized protein LOC124414121 [Diprion similis]
MFREGYYLEIIKAKTSAATAVITVKEKTVEIKNKKITTNKWLTLEDWASLYQVLEKGVIQNSEKKTRSSESKKRKKLTRHLEIVYTFEESENPTDRTTLPTIKVGVSPVKKKSRSKRDSTAGEVDKKEKIRVSSTSKAEHKNDGSNLPKLESSGETFYGTGFKVEEYIPNVPKTKGTENGADIKYIPSRKSALENLHRSVESNEYIPAIVTEEGAGTSALDDLYIPNSVPKILNIDETYEPFNPAITTSKTAGEYVPNSKGVKKKMEEYQPDFTSKAMKFDNSYVPSSSAKIMELKKNGEKSSSGSSSSSTSGSVRKKRSRDTESSTSKESSSKKKNSPVTQSTSVKREM